MLNYIHRFFLTLFFLNVSILSFAQENISSNPTIRLDQTNAQTQVNWIIWKNQIKPEDQKIYEEKISAIIEKAKKQQNFIRVLTFFEKATSTYYFLYPFLNINDSHKIYSFWFDESNRLDTKKYLIDYSIILTQSLPMLSQFPTSGQINLGNSDYVHAQYLQIQPGTEEKFYDLLREWTSTIKDKVPNCSWFVQKIILGENLPSYYIFWGDCLKNVENAVPLNKFLLDKQAYGTTVKKIVYEDRVYLPRLSTSSLETLGK